MMFPFRSDTAAVNENTEVFSTWSYYFSVVFILYLLHSLTRILFPRQVQNIYYKIQLTLLQKNIKIIEITTPEECATACYLIKSHCKDLNALGFDCEWVFWKGAPVALLQVATVHGLCYLFRLNVLTRIPSELQKILNNCDILKLGICPAADARYIERDYKVQVKS